MKTLCKGAGIGTHQFNWRGTISVTSKIPSVIRFHFQFFESGIQNPNEL